MLRCINIYFNLSPAADCKVRWINIRDVNRRILRKCLNNPGQRVRTYKYDSELSFMRPFYRDVPIKNNDYEFDDDPDKDEGIPMNHDDYNHHDDMEEQGLAEEFSDSEKIERKVRKTRAKRTKSVKRKKKRSYAEEEEEEVKPETSVFTESMTVPQELDPTDPVDAFLLSIGATLKTFNPYHLNVAKSKIFAVVQEHDLQQIVQRRDSQIEQKICTSDTMVYVNSTM